MMDSENENINPFDSLGNREGEVISLIVLGVDRKQIADQLKITRSAINTMVSRVYVKCKVNNLAQLLIKAKEFNFPYDDNHIVDKNPHS